MMCLETKTKAEIGQVWKFSLPIIFRWRARKGHPACARSLVAERKAILITQHSRQDGRDGEKMPPGKGWKERKNVARIRVSRTDQPSLGPGSGLVAKSRSAWADRTHLKRLVGC